MVSGRRIVVGAKARPRAGSGVPDRLALDTRKGRLALFKHVLRHASGLEHCHNHPSPLDGTVTCNWACTFVESLKSVGRVPGSPWQGAKWRPRLPLK